MTGMSREKPRGSSVKGSLMSYFCLHAFFFFCLLFLFLEISLCDEFYFAFRTDCVFLAPLQTLKGNIWSQSHALMQC